MIRTIPLDKLVRSERNVRRRSDPQADLELKADIAARGLLQNLVVTSVRKPRGRFAVEAGERRRRALQSLAEDGALPGDLGVACLVVDDVSDGREASLAENFQRLAMNPADECLAFQQLIEHGSDVETVARRFGLTTRFVEGRLRLAGLAPVVLEALAAGEITLDIAKAYGATSDQEIQARVFEQVSGAAYYAASPDSIRRMVLSGTVRGRDARARLVGREAYMVAGGRIERKLFDDEDSEAWADVALLEELAGAKMEEHARSIAEEQGLAWVRPTLEPYVSHELVAGLVRLPAEPAPLSEAETTRLGELEASYDAHAAVLEDEDSDEQAIAAAEAAIEAIDREWEQFRNRPPVLPAELKGEAGMILTLARDGTPVLQSSFYGERQPEADHGDEAIEVVPERGAKEPRRAALPKRLVDELAMQRRDVLSLHVAGEPGLALDLFVFALADTDNCDWRSRSATTLRGSAPSGPIPGFEAKAAPASAALAELTTGLDESWRAGPDAADRFDRFHGLPGEARAAWLGVVVARTLEASLNMAGERRIAFHDHLGRLTGIDIAQWWRPTAANYFDRVPKQAILEALGDVGGPELASRFGSLKKAELAASAERVFAGTYITDAEVRERALAWVPDVMRFAEPPGAPPDSAANDADASAPEDEPRDAGEADAPIEAIEEAA
jgi:ParB family chromosome partitioning protein